MSTFSGARVFKGSGNGCPLLLKMIEYGRKSLHSSSYRSQMGYEHIAHNASRNILVGVTRSGVPVTSSNGQGRHFSTALEDGRNCYRISFSSSLGYIALSFFSDAGHFAASDIMTFWWLVQLLGSMT